MPIIADYTEIKTATFKRAFYNLKIFNDSQIQYQFIFKEK